MASNDIPNQVSSPDSGQPPNIQENLFNIPNAISIFRIVGSFVLIFVAFIDAPLYFVATYMLLGITDLIDGPLARWLGCQTTTGAGLDSIADILLSLGLLTGVSLLCWDVIRSELWLITLALLSYVAAFALSLIRFGKIPALHTITAKANHFLVAMAGVLLVLLESRWPIRVAATTTILTNVELVAILLSISNWRTDIQSVFRLGHLDPEQD